MSPNPVSEQFQLIVNNPKHQDLNFSLIDANGRLIKKWTKEAVAKGKSYYDLRASSFNLKSGVYYIRVSTDQEQISQKLIILL